jgi:transposase
MGSHKDRPQVLRLEIVETGRRRRWSDAEKLRIVEESYSGHRLVSATARRHGIARSLLTTWRRAYREGRLGHDAAPEMWPVIVAPEAPPAARPDVVPVSRPAGAMEIVLASGRRIVVGPDVDAVALARIVAALEAP